MSDLNKKYTNLYKELNAKMEEEKLYWIRNDAKIKAVGSSASYEDFRQRVAAAHLKGMTLSEIKQKKATSWNKVSGESKINDE